MLTLVCVSVQMFDHMQLHWKLVSASSHYELILEPAAIEKGKMAKFTHGPLAACPTQILPPEPTA